MTAVVYTIWSLAVLTYGAIIAEHWWATRGEK